jgi:Ca2+-binding RTX toxin-like protein
VPGATEDNNVAVTLAGSTYTITDSESTMAASGTCTLVNTHQVDCPSSGVTSISLAGNDGSDTLISQVSTATSIAGGDGNDSIRGGSGADTLSGGNDNDSIVGGPGNDAITGNGGTDTADYSTATAGVTVLLSQSTAQNTVSAGTDTIGSVENLTGSPYNDDLRGTTGANTLSGGAGDDSLMSYWTASHS